MAARLLTPQLPNKVAELSARLRAYQATAVPATFHTLRGINCIATSSNLRQESLPLPKSTPAHLLFAATEPAVA